MPDVEPAGALADRALVLGVGVAILVGALAALVAVVLIKRHRRRQERGRTPSALTDAWAEAGRRLREEP